MKYHSKTLRLRFCNFKLRPKMAKNESRRNFLKLTGLGLAAGYFSSILHPFSKATFAKPINRKSKLTVGLASYSFRNFSLPETIEMTKRLGLKKISLKEMHLPLTSSKEEIKKVITEVTNSGLEVYGAGVIYMKNEEEVNRAFQYAKAAGVKVIIGVPDHDLLHLAEKKVKEYKIMLAIHNHGPNDERYPSPESAYEKIKNMDSRVGLCLDVGHTMRLGIDPSEVVEKYSDRIFDIHLKDVDKASDDGSTVEIGRGVIDITKLLNTLIKKGYKGTAALEFEKDKENPLPGVAESLGFIKGVLSVI
jgi:inosose dehydratase